MTFGGFTNHIPDYYPPYTIGDFSYQAYYGKFYAIRGICCFKKEIGFNVTISVAQHDALDHITMGAILMHMVILIMLH